MIYPTANDSDNSNTSLDLLVRENDTRDISVPTRGPQLGAACYTNLWSRLRRFYGTRQQKYLSWIVITLALGSLLWGFNVTVIAGAMLFVDDYFHLSALWHEIIVSVTIAGAAVGAVAAGALSDKWGRRKVLMVSAVLYGVGAVVLAAAFSQLFLVLGRILVGLAIGIYTVTGPIYSSEMSPSHLRGKLGVINILFATNGGIVGTITAGLFSINYTFAYSYGWRFMFGFGLLPSIALLVSLWFLFETPRWLVFHGEINAARAILQKIRPHTTVEIELSDIIKEHEDIQQSKVGIGECINKAVHSGRFMHALFVGIGLSVISALSGTTLMATYGATILRMAGFDTRTAIWLTLLPICASVSSSVMVSLVIEKTGRRKPCIISGVGTSFCLFLLATSFYMENNDSQSAVPSQGGGVCDYDKCGSCVANSHCGFCALHANNKYINGTCIRGSREYAITRINDSQCAIESNYNITNHNFRWHFDFCPESKLVIFSLSLIILYWVFVSFGPAVLLWTINSEIYPTWARGKAVAITMLFYYITVLVTLLTFLTMVDTIGQPMILATYGAISVCGTIFIILLLPETSKNQLEGMDKLFCKPHFFTWGKVIFTCRKSIQMYTEVELQILIQERSRLGTPVTH